MQDCEYCEYSDKDYIFDDELGEEYPLYICKKGNDTSFDFECKDFKKYTTERYVEKDTKCDKCQYLKECMVNYEVLNCTTSEDTRSHYVVGAGNDCKNKEVDNE